MKSRNPFPRGFTLIELLVVMTIIAVLAGGIFSAAQFAIRNSQKVRAQHSAVGLAQGITNFTSDYGRFPFPSGTKAEKFDSNAAFMINLTGKDAEFNKRSRNFVDGMPLAKGAPPVGGLYYQGNSAELFDSWGNYFEIRMDHDGDGQVDNPEGGDKLNLKVAVISKGFDKTMSGVNPDDPKIPATKDNPRSW